MGKLKQYQESGVQFSGMPQLSTAPIQEALASNERVNNFLSQVGQTFAKKANVYASEQAVKDAITNPITKEQIDQARKTGDNPIEQFLTGGTTYNDAIKKVLGQQVAGELRLELDQASSSILEMVRTGEITNQGQALQQLQEPISAHVEFLTTIDPTLAEAYGAQATASARNYLNQADTVIRNREEENRLANAKTMQSNMLRDYQNYTIANPNASLKQKTQYKETISKMARDFAFSNTRKQEALVKEMDEMLLEVDRGHYAKYIASKYPNKTFDEIRELLPKDKSDAANFYMQSADKESFLKDVKYELGLLSDDRQGRQAQLASDMTDANLYLRNGRPIEPMLKERIEQNLDPESSNGKKALAILQVSDNIERWNKTSYSDLQAEFDTLDKKKKNINYPLSVTEMTEHSTMQEYLVNLSDSLQNDYTQTVLQRDGKFQSLDFNDPFKLKQDVDERIKNLKGSAERYGSSSDVVTRKILTAQEAKAFVAAYDQADGNTRIALLQTLDQSFGRNSSKVIAQLSNEGLPFTAQLSSYLNDPIQAQKFMNLDNPAEQEVLKKSLSDRPDKLTFADIRRDVRSELGEFENVLMRNYSNDPSTALSKVDSIVETLSLYAAQEMKLGVKKSKALDNAVNLINNNFSFQETYHIPLKINGDGIGERRLGQIIDKANNIKENVSKFNSIAFRSSDPSIPDEEMNLEMKRQLETFGEWRNTPDGNGLVYGIVLDDGSFAPVVNNVGKTLSFEFDDLSMVMPHTDVELVQTTRTEVGFGFNPSSTYYGDVKGAIEDFERAKQESSIPDDMYRRDGSMKSEQGFLGPVQDNTGRIMTEVSMQMPITQPDGIVVEMEVPSMVPGLTQKEIDYLKTNPAPEERNKLADSIAKKAAEHAEKRLREGKSVFYVDGE